MNNLQKYFENIEKKIGMTLEEMKDISPLELRTRFVKNPFEELNPFEKEDAQKILREYTLMEKKYYEYSEIMPREVIDAKLTLNLF